MVEFSGFDFFWIASCRGNMWEPALKHYLLFIWCPPGTLAPVPSPQITVTCSGAGWCALASSQQLREIPKESGWGETSVTPSTDGFPSCYLCWLSQMKFVRKTRVTELETRRPGPDPLLPFLACVLLTRGHGWLATQAERLSGQTKQKNRYSDNRKYHPHLRSSGCVLCPDLLLESCSLPGLKMTVSISAVRGRWALTWHWTHRCFVSQSREGSLSDSSHPCLRHFWLLGFPSWGFSPSFFCLFFVFSHFVCFVFI